MERKLFVPVSLVIVLLVLVLAAAFAGQVAAASKVTVCHKPGPNQVIVDVNAAALDAHLAHGDILGGLRATELVAPAPGAIMDNGRLDRSDPIVWDFEWRACGEATAYQLYVQGSNAIYPIIDTVVTEPSYHFESYGYISSYNRIGWEWKVRAYVDGEWGPWSEVWTFDVEPPNSD